jgi:hypothetical protein
VVAFRRHTREGQRIFDLAVEATYRYEEIGNLSFILFPGLSILDAALFDIADCPMYNHC